MMMATSNVDEIERWLVDWFRRHEAKVHTRGPVRLPSGTANDQVYGGTDPYIPLGDGQPSINLRDLARDLAVTKADGA